MVVDEWNNSDEASAPSKAPSGLGQTITPSLPNAVRGWGAVACARVQKRASPVLGGAATPALLTTVSPAPPKRAIPGLTQCTFQGQYSIGRSIVHHLLRPSTRLRCTKRAPAELAPTPSTPCCTLMAGGRAMSPPCWLFLTLLTYLISTVDAAISASTFVLPQRVSNLTFSLNIDRDSSDIYFRLTASADYSWVAVGIGSEMRGSLMFVAYQGKDSKAVTISPRIASGNVEPTYAPFINVTLEPGSGTISNRFIVNARCTNCRKWDHGTLDVNSTAQDFIYAWGPTRGLIATDSKSALMQRHSAFGFFAMNMTHASSGDAGVPEETNISSNASGDENAHGDHNFVLFTHVLFMLGSFVILLPLGVLFLRVFQKVKLHSINQSIAIVVVLTGGGLGIYMSTFYNLTRSFNTAHQILGLILMALLIVQSILGNLHHRTYLRTQRRSTYSHAHIWQGRLIMIFGILNGFLGLKLAGRSSIGYLIGLLVFIGIYAVIYFVFWTRTRRQKAAYISPRARNFRDGDSSSFGNSRTDIPLTAHAAPPAYQPDDVQPPPGPRLNRL